MNTVYDPVLRAALHQVYVAQFKANFEFPGVFTKADLTRMLTGLMGSRPWSWRVVGITPAALCVFADHDFKRVRGLVERGHLQNRASTANSLFFDRDTPFEIDEFFDFFLERDKTVLIAKHEHKSNPEGRLPDYLPIPAERRLFPCGTLIGWQHRKEEVEFLRELHALTQTK